MPADSMTARCPGVTHRGTASLNLQTRLARSIPSRNRRAPIAPVEAPDQLAAHGLDEGASLQAVVEAGAGRGMDEEIPITLELGEAIFRLPEQAGEPLDPVLITAA